MPDKRPAIAILASGAASRFGGGKLQAHLGGKPLAAHVIEAALSHNLPVAIVGRDDEAVFWHKCFPSCSFIANPIALQGIGTSIRGAAHWAATDQAAGLALLLADMPFVSNQIISQLIMAIESGWRAACRYPDGGVGIPAAFPADDIPALTQIPEHMGARHLLEHDSTLILRPPHNTLIDVDTKADLAKAQRQFAESYA